MNALDFISNFFGLLVSVVSSVFLYVSFKNGPQVYRKPLFFLTMGLVVMAVSFSLPLFETIISTPQHVAASTHHLLMAISVLLFAGSAKYFFTVGR